MNTLKAVLAIMALIGSACAWTPRVQAVTPPVFTKTVTSLITPTSGAPLALRAGSVVLADFNGDGQIDAAVPGTILAGVAVFLNNGSGSATQTWYDAGASPVALAAGDFDGDGDVDMAVALKGEGGVAILTNDGTGQFARTAFYATGVGATAVEAVDINQDGRMDLVVANRGDGSISVLINTGSGFFVLQKLTLPAALPAGVPAICSQPNALAVVDLDTDGAPDVVVACAGDDSVKILYNVNHRLVLGGTYAAGPCPVAVAAADLNNDHQPDLVVADFESPQVTILRQDMTGQFTPQDVFLVSLPYESFAGVSDVMLLDLDGNSSPDIRCSGYSLYNNGLGQFGTAQYQSTTNGFCGQARLSQYRGTFVGTAASGSVSLSYVPDARIIGDVNGDRVVNVADLQLLVTAWGSWKTPPSSNWNESADLNADGFVNIGDLQMMVAVWGAQL